MIEIKETIRNAGGMRFNNKREAIEFLKRYFVERKI